MVFSHLIIVMISYPEVEMRRAVVNQLFFCMICYLSAVNSGSIKACVHQNVKLCSNRVVVVESLAFARPLNNDLFRELIQGLGQMTVVQRLPHLTEEGERPELVRWQTTTPLQKLTSSLCECQRIRLFVDVSSPDSLKSRDRLDDAVLHPLLLGISVFFQKLFHIIVIGALVPFTELIRNLGTPACVGRKESGRRILRVVLW